MADYSLTKKQEAAVAELKKAFAACRRAGVYFWDDYCEIRAINGRVALNVCVDPNGSDGPFDREQATNVFSLPTSNADDPLYVKLRD